MRSAAISSSCGSRQYSGVTFLASCPRSIVFGLPFAIFFNPSLTRSLNCLAGIGPVVRPSGVDISIVVVSFQFFILNFFLLRIGCFSLFALRFSQFILESSSLRRYRVDATRRLRSRPGKTNPTSPIAPASAPHHLFSTRRQVGAAGGQRSNRENPRYYFYCSTCDNISLLKASKILRPDPGIASP